MTKRLLELLAGFVPAAIACLVPVALVFCDIAVFGLECDEAGVVEISQSAALLATVALVGCVAKKRGDLRGGLVLVAGFFLAMLIREQDQVLEEFLPHGAWVVPCALATAGAAAIAFANRDTLLPALAHVRANGRFPWLALGVMTVIGYARIFGSKYIWKAVVGTDDCYRAVKHVAEEGTELFGYAMILSWAICYFKDAITEGGK